MNKIKIEMKWALIFSVVGLLWIMLEKLSRLHSTYIDYHLYLTNLFAIPAIVMMVLALQQKKKHFYKGMMTYKQGLISGVILSVLIAVLSPVTQAISTYIISPDFFPTVTRRSVELGYYKTIEAAQANFNYANYALQGALGALVMGILTTAIAMIFIRTKTS